MILKPGVRVAGAKPELLIGLRVAESVYKGLAGRELTVTSISDGVHKKGSKHYVGMAADLRINDLLPGLAEQIVEALSEQLERDFDIVLEADHIHLEYDPK